MKQIKRNEHLICFGDDNRNDRRKFVERVYLIAILAMAALLVYAFMAQK